MLRSTAQRFPSHMVKTPKPLVRQRNEHGQTMFFGAGIMLMMTMIICGMVVLILWVSTAMYFQSKLAQALEAGTRYGAESGRWLGAPRPTYVANPAALPADVQDVVWQCMFQTTNMPSALLTNVDLSNTSMVQANSTATSINTIPGTFLPTLIVMNANAVTVYNSRPNGVLDIQFEDGTAPSAAAQDMIFPSYGAGNWNTEQAIAGPTSSPRNSPLVPPPDMHAYPYWETGVASATPLNGPFQNLPTGGTFTSY